MHLIVFVNNVMRQAHGFVSTCYHVHVQHSFQGFQGEAGGTVQSTCYYCRYKTMCLPHGIVDKDNEMHIPS